MLIWRISGAGRTGTTAELREEDAGEMVRFVCTDSVEIARWVSRQGGMLTFRCGSGEDDDESDDGSDDGGGGPADQRERETT